MAEVFDDAIAALRQHRETREAGEPAAARWSGAVAEVTRVRKVGRKVLEVYELVRFPGGEQTELDVSVVVPGGRAGS